MKYKWYIITGEYPPQLGGVSDYTQIVARGLSAAGDDVTVWAPHCGEPTPAIEGVKINRLPDRFGARGLAKLRAEFSSASPRRILVQYVPQAYGFKGFNLPFCRWLASLREHSVWVMFHEVAVPLTLKQPLSHNALGIATAIMARTVARAAERAFVSIPAWEDLLKRLAPKQENITWLPVPSNIPFINDAVKIADIRQQYLIGNGKIIGHFGTYSADISKVLREVIKKLLSLNSNAAILLLGKGGESLQRQLVEENEAWRNRIHAPGSLPADDLSLYLNACDVMIQPYPDGISSRRTSVMSALSHRRPVVTTSGHATESFWQRSEAVVLAPTGNAEAILAAARKLLTDEEARWRLSERAGALYEQKFDVKYTILALREAAATDRLPA